MLPTIHGEFRLVDDPDLKFTPSGTAVSNFRIVADKQKKDDDGKWVDDKKVFLRATCWKQVAENVAESLRKGDLVNISGVLEGREYETDGQKRTSYEVTVWEIGPSLRFRAILHSDGQGGKATREGAADAPSPAANDPWATPPPGDEPPF